MWLLRRAGWSLTPAGKRWLLIVFVLLAVGIGKNINLVALLGFLMLAVLALNGLVVGRRLRRLEGRRVVEEQVFAGSSGRVEVRLRNTSSRPCRGVQIEEKGPEH